MHSDSCPQPTGFAPAERLSLDEIQRQVAAILSVDRLRALIDSIPSVVLVLNAERQILVGNNACEDLARTLKVESFVGLRFGEFLSCHRANCAEHGCGTTEGCRTCGSIRATLSAAAGRRTSEDCSVRSVSGAAYDLRVTASPFLWDGGNYLLVVIGDISGEKRRQVLERIFFHDVLNTAGSISGIASLLADQPALSYELKDDLRLSADTLVNEIRAQRTLVAAENNELVLQLREVPVRELLETVRQLYRNHPVYAGRQIEIDPDTVHTTLRTDPMILQRVLANMVKNALEAAADGKTVQIGAGISGREVVFWCRNDEVIPHEAALQVFQRSFSTKSTNRGVGTYSMKLLGERYLGGHVTFTSSAGAGTRFQISLPRGETTV